jgi:2-polyprenyl-6-methoxyphenol hydroxylase-like FAD-dependent oxidoreductase
MSGGSRNSGGEAPVLIAGGGLVGLSAAAFLAQRGIRSLAMEKLTATSPLPRAAFFHMRTMELFRSLGIEDLVRERSAQDFVPERGHCGRGVAGGPQAGGHHAEPE